MATIIIRALDGSAIQALTNKSAAQPYIFKRGTTPQVGVQYADEDGDSDPLPDGAVVTLGIKPGNPNNTIVAGTPAFDGPYTVSGTTSAGPDDDGIYWLGMNFANNAALNALLGFNPPAINDDVASVSLFAEVAWTYNGATVCGKSVTFPVIVYHDINTGTEAVDTAAGGTDTSSYVNNWMTIERLAGGTPTDLDSQTTAGVLAFGTVILLTAIPGYEPATLWMFQNRTDATGPGLQRPLDFNAATNPGVWTQIM